MSHARANCRTCKAARVCLMEGAYTGKKRDKCAVYQTIDTIERQKEGGRADAPAMAEVQNGEVI
jgi:hypothetical protein